MKNAKKNCSNGNLKNKKKKKNYFPFSLQFVLLLIAAVGQIRDLCHS